jgi:hypothetical protein
MIRTHPFLLAGLGATLTPIAGGCGGRQAGYEQYVPPAGVARSAVASVLRAWVDGRPPTQAAATHPEVYVVDKQRRPGQRLTRYEILGDFAGEKARGVTVRMTMENPDEEGVVRYLVAGIDPVWVFRQEDFELISHWMHPMKKPGEEGESDAKP